MAAGGGGGAPDEWKGGGSDDWKERGKRAVPWVEQYDDSGDEWLGWLVNYDVSTIVDEQSKVPHQCMTLIFYHEDGRTFKGDYVVRPYFYVIPEPGSEEEVELGLKSALSADLAEIARVEKEDLELSNHLSGLTRTLLKLSFFNVKQLVEARNKLVPFVEKNVKRHEAETFSMDFITGREKGTGGGNFTDRIIGLREYDVKYHVRVAIDKGIYVGKWYYVTGENGTIQVRERTEYLTNAKPRICAFDIETTKAPLKFPRPDEDQVYMISWMLDGHGFLIINREIVTQDIEDFEYTPSPDYEGIFEVFNERNEEATLRKFIELMREQKPHVYVTYNGDCFDFPFIIRRLQDYKMNLWTELGFKDNNGEITSNYINHLDCMYWVNRDSYLPQGSRSLKAVSRAKLGYDPLEIDPEDMLPLAKEDPQKMASYSVSDAVATYYLYMKYVHPFIFSLCTIIPMSPDEVLRKGSGTLCEQLLMVQAFEKNVICPNKQVSKQEKFYKGHLLDVETYIGGHVEALQSGVFRADIPLQWNVEPAAYQRLIDDVYGVLKFALEVELNTPLSEIENFDEVMSDVIGRLSSLRDKPKRKEVPHIIHLDVGAMYPNIILTNRLQPPSMVTEETCSACCFNSPENDCKRPMKWIWRGEYFVLDKGEFNRIKTQLQTEKIQTKKIDDITKKMAGKKAWKFAKKPLFETKKKRPNKFGQPAAKGGYEGGGTGYRKGKNSEGMADLLREAERKALGSEPQKDAEEEDDGLVKYKDLPKDQQFAILKKRVTDYSRKAYAKIHATQHEDRVTTVCQRENSFYVDTVKLFRDRRVAYKKELKKWWNITEEVKEGSNTEYDLAECKGRLVLYESLQLAHKCILNSFYGYVMRKGSRWYSMEMAAAVTLCGASLIMMSRELVDSIGLSLELDTDGIWCCLPGSFPMDLVFKSKAGRKIKVSYPCAMLNKDVETRYENKQYQTLQPDGSYTKSTECTIFFEIDGPYRAMILPAAKEEGKGIKKRYAVFEFDGSLAELKGFELKRRGELQLIKDFQQQIFGSGSMFLDGKSLNDAYNNAARVADMCLDILSSKGSQLDTQQLMDKISESTSMSRRLVDYPKDQRSMAITTARRIADFLGEDMTKDAGLKCNFIVAKKPDGQPVTCRPIPTQIFQATRDVRVHWIRKWCQDPSLGQDGEDIDIREILDWDYYMSRLSGNIMKIITIPAALQGVPNPNNRVHYPDWLKRVVAERKSGLVQTTLDKFAKTRPKAVQRMPAASKGSLGDVEDLGKKRLAPLDLVTQRDDAPAAAPTIPKAFSKNYLSSKYDPPKPMAPAAYYSSWADGFLNDSTGFSKFLAHAKNVWTSGGNVPTTKSAFVQQMGQSNAFLNDQWEIIEARKIPTDPPSVVRLLIFCGDSVRVARVVVPITVLVNSRTEWSDELVEGYGATNSELVLPRKVRRHHLYEIPLTTLPSSDKVNDLVHTLRNEPDVLGVFESEVDASRLFQIKIGRRCKVNIPKYEQRSFAERDLFHMDDLTPLQSAKDVPSHGFSDQVSDLFLYQSFEGTKGIIALIIPHRGLVRVIYIRGPTRGQDPTLRWSDLLNEATQETAKHIDTNLSQGEGQDDKLLKHSHHTNTNLGTEIFGSLPTGYSYDTSFTSDRSSAWNLINDELKVDMIVSRRAILLQQTQLPRDDVIKKLPQLSGLPVLTIPFNHSDTKLYSHPISWMRDFGRRLLYRYISARPYAAGICEISQEVNIPACNSSANDAYIQGLDVMYARSLKNNYHCLWYSSGNVPDLGRVGSNDDDIVLASTLTETLKPLTVNISGSHHTWVVELDVLHLEVVAILAEEPGASDFTSDLDVTSHFHILRDMIWSLYTKTVKSSNHVADSLMAEVTRWLKSTSSLLYEPQITAFIINLSKRLFERLLTRLTRLGCRVVYADVQRLVLATPKTDLKDCATFTNYFLTALRDQAIFKRIHLEVSAFWSEYLNLNRSNYAGMKIPGIEASPSGGVVLSGVDFGHLESQAQVAFYWTVADRLPSTIKTRFVLFIAEYLATLNMEKKEVISLITSESTGGQPLTMASTTERIRKDTFARMRNKVENKWTNRVLKEVHNIRIEQRELGRTNETDYAIDYAKILCHVLGQEDQLGESVRQLKTAVLQILGVATHSKDAVYVEQDDLFSLDNVMCTFCHSISTLDLLPGGLTSPDQYRISNVFTCSCCNQQFDKNVIESKLVDVVNHLTASHEVQDLLCQTCRQPQEYDLQVRCSCGGEWVASEVTSSHVAHQLHLLQGVAELHSLDWLAAVVHELITE